MGIGYVANRSIVNPDEEVPRIIESFERWLASVKAEAWDEGHHAGRLNETYRDHTRNFWRTPPTNPYREQETR